MSSNDNEAEEAEESDGEDNIIQGATPTYSQEEVSGPNPDQPQRGREKIMREE